MGRQIQALRGQAPRANNDLNFSELPFTRHIMEELIPFQFKMPQVKPYDGIANPLDHLESFNALMMLHEATDIVLCEALPATLHKVA